LVVVDMYFRKSDDEPAGAAKDTDWFVKSVWGLSGLVSDGTLPAGSKSG
jgi:hypothetical protein